MFLLRFDEHLCCTVTQDLNFNHHGLATSCISGLVCGFGVLDTLGASARPQDTMELVFSLGAHMVLGLSHHCFIGPSSIFSEMLTASGFQAMVFLQKTCHSYVSHTAQNYFSVSPV